jgi:type IV fimbrial biogenesis protein FimT
MFKQQGFSLVELMIGVTVLVTLTSLAIPSFKSSIGNAEIRTVAESVKNGLQLARLEAIKRNTEIKFTLTTDTAWEYGCNTASSTCPAKINSKNAKEGASSNISLTITTGNTVIFNSLGLRDTESTISRVDISNTNLTTTERKPLRITVSAGGSAKVCDPAVTATGDPRKC